MKQANVLESQGQIAMGISGIKKNIERAQVKNQQEISSAFADLESLKQKSKGMVKIAETIKQRIQKKELTENEMQEI